MLIVNADDWGRCVADTDEAEACIRAGRVTSVTAMVFMADSERAARRASELGIPTGLHINFSETFSGQVRDARIARLHADIVRYIGRKRMMQLVYNPLLHSAFVTVFRAQLEEFQRLYGRLPSHFDGHQHMHLSANMLVARPIPPGSKVRRCFSFNPGEKSALNRAYRGFVDRWMAARYLQTTHFFALSQRMAPDQMSRVCALARTSTVELMCHPAVAPEGDYLRGGEFGKAIQGIRLGSYLELEPSGGRGGHEVAAGAAKPG